MLGRLAPLSVGAAGGRVSCESRRAGARARIQGGIGQQRAARREGWMFLLRESGQSGSVVSHEKKKARGVRNCCSFQMLASGYN